jgi:hypothetical protein
MDEIEKAQVDLQYLRSVAGRVAEARSPASIPLLWALISIVGFPLLDFAPHRAHWYWMVGAPLATCLTAVLGYRSHGRLGQLDRAKGWRHLAHWVGLLVATTLAVLSSQWGVIGDRATPTIVLLVLAFGFWTAGVHLERPLRWVALLMLVGYLLVIAQVVPYQWTVVGLAVSGGLVVMALSGTRPDAD